MLQGEKLLGVSGTKVGVLVPRVHRCTRAPQWGGRHVQEERVQVEATTMHTDTHTHKTATNPDGKRLQCARLGWVGSVRSDRERVCVLWQGCRGSGHQQVKRPA